MTNLRVGVLGYGIAGAVFHAPLIASTPGLVLDSVVTRNPERQEQVRRDHPDATVVETAFALWERRPDLVVVATPNRTHVPLALAAVEAGIPVVVDKPFAPAVGEGQRLLDRARELGVLLTVFQNRRWDADALTVRRLLDEGVFGTVSRFESRYERWRPALRDNWRELADAGEAGGLLYDLGSHLVDQALHLFGPVRSVYAELDSRRAGSAVDDDAFVALTHESGVRSHLWVSALTAQLGPRFRVLGAEAGFTKYGMDVQEDALRAGGRPGDAGWGEEPRSQWGMLGLGDSSRQVPSEPGAYQEFYAGVERALRGDGPVPVEPAEAVAALVVLEAARRSASTGTVVRLP
jgi:scyllo-inositol 2-dehydrogenase (NADP+)